MTGACPWCTGPAWLCMHVCISDEDEKIRFAEFLARTGQKLERTPDDDPFYTEAGNGTQAD